MSAADLVAAADGLARFTTEIFVRAGLSNAHALTVADALVWANLRGVDSHGVMRVPRYVELIEVGDLNPNPAITVKTETPAAVLIDADRAAGPVAMTFGMTAAVRKARALGVGLALVRGTTHTAALGYYTLAAARENMAALALAGSTPNMAYHGARAAGVSTSPISIAVPGGEHAPILFDMGTGIVSIGKLMRAKHTGQSISDGWALDQSGNPTTDPQAAHIPMPLGGPKGSGLSLMIECIASVLAANPLLSESLEGTAVGHRHRQNGLALAIDIARFVDIGTFRDEIDRLVKAIKRLPRDPSVDEILVPGERGDRVFETRTRDGIPIPRATYEALRRVAEKLGVTMFPTSER